MTPNRAQRRAEKQQLLREANRLWHEEETFKGMRLVITGRKGRIKERKFSRWFRRRKRLTPAA